MKMTAFRNCLFCIISLCMLILFVIIEVFLFVHIDFFVFLMIFVFVLLAHGNIRYFSPFANPVAAILIPTKHEDIIRKREYYFALCLLMIVLLIGQLTMTVNKFKKIEGTIVNYWQNPRYDEKCVRGCTRVCDAYFVQVKFDNGSTSTFSTRKLDKNFLNKKFDMYIDPMDSIFDIMCRYFPMIVSLHSSELNLPDRRLRPPVSYIVYVLSFLPSLFLLCHYFIYKIKYIMKNKSDFLSLSV